MRATFAIIVVAAACVELDEAPPVEPADHAPGEITTLFGERPATFGVFEVGTAWPNDHLSVCWMDEVLSDEAEPFVEDLVEVAEEVVMREWHRVGRVRFSSAPWVACSRRRNSNIRIGFETRVGFDGFSEFGTDALAVPAGAATMSLRMDATVAGCTSGPGDACDEEQEDEENPRGLTVGEKRDFQHVVLHEFGHALGMRHANAHEDAGQDPDPDCRQIEPPDANGNDGQSIWPYDPDSVLNKCRRLSLLSSGDIRVLHTLYPGAVGLYTEPNFVHGTDGTSQPILLGPGYYTLATMPDLDDINSIVVPPGYSVRICGAGGNCAFASTSRELSWPFADAIQDILITPVVLGSDLLGYQGATAQLAGTRDAPFGALVDDAMSSVFPGPTRAAHVCTDAGGGGTCSATFVGGGAPDAFQLPAGIDGAVSHASISKRVVTYSGLFSGDSSALTTGVYKASTAQFPLIDVKSLAISGLEVRACTQEGVSTLQNPGGAGDCRIYTQSVDLAATGHHQIRFLHVQVPLIIAP